MVWVHEMLSKIPTVPNILVPLMNYNNINISVRCPIIDLEPKTSLQKNKYGSLTDIVRFKLAQWWLLCSKIVDIIISNH